MVQKVNVPGVGVLQFPDDMPKDQIAAAIRRNFPHLHQAAPAWTPSQDRADYERAYQQHQAQMVSELPWYQRMAIGAGKAVGDTWLGIKELTGHATPQEVQNARERDQAIMATGAGKVGNILGYVGEAVPAAIVGGAVAPEAAAGASLAAKMGIGGATGLAQGYAMPYASRGEHIRNALMGLATGAVLPGAGAAVKGTLGGLARGVATPEARALMAEGVKLTPGQMLGGGFKTAEDKLTSLPIVGTAIKQARGRSVESFNRAAINRALSKVDMRLPDKLVGYPAIAHAQNAISDVYENTLSHMKGSIDGTLAQDVAKIWNKWGNKLPKKEADELEQYISENIMSKFDQHGEAAGQTVHEIQSELGASAKKLRNSDELSKRQLGQAVTDLRSSVKSMFKRQNSADMNQAYDKATQAYKQMVRINKAAGSVGAREGVFSPAQLRSAVRSSDTSRLKRAYTTGKAEMQDLSNRAMDIIPASIPDSGTAGRYLMDSAIYGGGIMSGHILPFAAAGGIAHALYSRPGTALAERLAAPEMGAVRNYLARLAESRGMRAVASPANVLAVNPALSAPRPQQ